MKKLTALLLLIAVLILAAGCQAPESGTQNIPDTSDTLDTSNTQDTADTPDDSGALTSQENLYAISVPFTFSQVLADDGTAIFDYAEQAMYLTVPDNDVADRIIIDFLTRIDEARLDAEQVHDQAVADYNSADDWIPYAYQLSYSPSRIDQGVLSLFGEMIIFSGGSHSGRTCISASYDMVTGDVLTLGSILYHLDAKDDLCQLVIDKLQDLSKTTYLYDYYEDAVKDHFDQDESHLECFYFTTDALCFYFAPYELAPYSSGVITVSIPYAELTGIIGDQFFPAERQTSTGNMEAHLFSEADLEQFQQFAELTTDPGGEKIILSTDGIIHDVQIHSGYWNEDGTVFYQRATVFAANVLNPTDAIRLETYIPDAMPNLLLTYESGGSTCGYFIFQSGKDGSIILEPTDIA